MKNYRRESDAIAKKLYTYHGRDQILDGGRTLLKDGDILVSGRSWSNGMTEYVSARGAALKAPWPSGAGLSRTLPDGAGMRDVYDALDAMERQAGFLDAEKYTAATDGSAAAAYYKSNNGGMFSVEREGTDYTLVNGMTRKYSGLPAAQASGFNPGQTPVKTRSSLDRHEAELEARTAMTPIGKVAAMVRGMASGAVSPGDPQASEAMSDRRRENALDLIRHEVGDLDAFKDAAMRGGDMSVHGVEPGTVLSWTEHISGHGIGMQTHSSHMALVVSNDPETGLRVADLLSGKPGKGAASIPATGPLEGMDGLYAGQIYGVSRDRYYDAGMRKMPGGTIDGHTLANIQRKHPAPDPMAIYRAAATRSPGPAGRLRAEDLAGKSAVERLLEAVERQDDGNPAGMDGGPGSMDGPSL